MYMIVAYVSYIHCIYIHVNVCILWPATITIMYIYTCVCILILQTWFLYTHVYVCECVAFWTDESVLFSEVSLIQGLLSTQMWHLGQIKVSCLERCP